MMQNLSSSNSLQGLLTVYILKINCSPGRYIYFHESK